MSEYNEATQETILNAARQHDSRVILTTANNNPEYLQKIAFPGTCYVYHKASHWGNGDSYLSEKLYNPTWLDLCLTANDMLHHIDDHDHIFLEGAKVFDDYQGEKYIRLMMGS